MKLDSELGFSLKEIFEMSETFQTSSKELELEMNDVNENDEEVIYE